MASSWWLTDVHCGRCSSTAVEFSTFDFFKHQIGSNMSQHILMFKHVQTIIYDLGEISPSVWWSFFVFSRALNWNGPRDWCGHCWIPSTIHCPWITSNWSLAIWENYRFYTSEHVDIKNIYIYIFAFHTSPPILSVKKSLSDLELGQLPWRFRTATSTACWEPSARRTRHFNQRHGPLRSRRH